MVRLKEVHRWSGCWLLAAGCWLLAAGCWLLVAKARRAPCARPLAGQGDP